MANYYAAATDAQGRLTAPSVLSQIDARTKATMRADLPALAEELKIGGAMPEGGEPGQVLTTGPDGTAAWAPAPKGDTGRGIKSIVSSTSDPTKATVTYTDNTTEVITLPAGAAGAAGKSIKSFGDPDGEGVSVVTFSDGTTTTITLPVGNVTQNPTWSKDAQAKAQGYWIVVSDEAPSSPTYTTADGTVVPVIWQKPIEVTVPVLPQTPAFSRASSTLSVPDLVGVVYRLTGWSKDSGVTWTAISKDLVGGAVTDVKAATGQALPITVRVEAFAKPGYVLPNPHKWTFDYPDPNATVVVTSDTFAGGDVSSVHTRMTDATLGGTAMQWSDAGGSYQVLGGRLAPTGKGGTASLGVGAFNMEIEFDLVRTDGVATGGPGLNQIDIRVGSDGGWSNGFGFNSNRVYENGGHVGSYAGVGELGHYKMSVIGQTARITAPGGQVYTRELTTARTPTQTKVLLMAWSGSTTTWGIDNLVVKQVGY